MLEAAASDALEEARAVVAEGMSAALEPFERQQSAFVVRGGAVL